MFLPTVLARQIGNYDLTLPRWGSDTTSELEKENASAGINNNDSTGGGKRLNTSIRSAYSGSDITRYIHWGLALGLSCTIMEVVTIILVLVLD